MSQICYNNFIFAPLLIHKNAKRDNRTDNSTPIYFGQTKDFPYATGELSRLLRDIILAARIINREVNKAGLVDILGNHGSINVQGEDVKN